MTYYALLLKNYMYCLRTFRDSPLVENIARAEHFTLHEMISYGIRDVY